MDRDRILKGTADGQERLLLAKTIDLAETAAKKHSMVFSDFLDAAKSGSFYEKLTACFPDLHIFAWGGMEDCERRMLAFAPDYMEITPEDFPICAIAVSVERKFTDTALSHRDYLGSVLGLGIDRSRLGDILVKDDGALLFVAEGLADFVSGSLRKVGRVPVHTALASPADFSQERKTQLQRLTVASLRMDAVAGAVFHLSRGKMQGLISAEKVQVNWSSATHADKTLKEGDMVSCRGFGRFRVGSVGGNTKKGRIVVEIEKFIS